MKSAALDALRSEADAILGRPLTAAEADNFTKYLNLLIKWNRSQRLVGSAEPEWIVRSLFLDSLLFVRVLPAPARKILDLGSGSGVPGIPIKIVRNDADLTLLESRRKRASFLSTVVRDLSLQGIRIMNSRLEDVAEALAGRFDAVVMRCAGRLDALAEPAVRLLGPGGVAIASGPPEESDLKIGEWVSVRLDLAGPPRLFAVFRSPSGQAGTRARLP